MKLSIYSEPIFFKGQQGSTDLCKSQPSSVSAEKGEEAPWREAPRTCAQRTCNLHIFATIGYVERSVNATAAVNNQLSSKARLTRPGTTKKHHNEAAPSSPSARSIFKIRSKRCCLPPRLAAFPLLEQSTASVPKHSLGWVAQTVRATRCRRARIRLKQNRIDCREIEGFVVQEQPKKLNPTFERPMKKEGRVGRGGSVEIGHQQEGGGEICVGKGKQRSAHLQTDSPGPRRVTLELTEAPTSFGRWVENAQMVLRSLFFFVLPRPTTHTHSYLPFSRVDEVGKRL